MAGNDRLISYCPPFLSQVHGPPLAEAAAKGGAGAGQRWDARAGFAPCRCLAVRMGGMPGRLGGYLVASKAGVAKPEVEPADAC